MKNTKKTTKEVCASIPRGCEDEFDELIAENVVICSNVYFVAAETAPVRYANQSQPTTRSRTRNTASWKHSTKKAAQYGKNKPYQVPRRETCKNLRGKKLVADKDEFYFADCARPTHFPYREMFAEAAERATAICDSNRT